MEATSCLDYSNINSESYAKSFCSNISGIENYLLNYKLPQAVTFTPSYASQTKYVQGKNRYIQSAQVAPILPATITASLAASAVITFNSPYIIKGTSSNTAYATVSVADNVATITGVAAGTATIVLTDGKNTVATLTITVA